MELISFIADKRKICRELNKDEGVVHMILCHIYDIEPSSLYLHYYKEINKDVINSFETYFTPYLNDSYPLQYLLGYTYFYGLKLEVNSNVLIPRSETEELVEKVLKDHQNILDSLVIADIGTGSGAIALALKHNRKQDKVIACDISLSALEVAKRNAQRLGLELEFKQSNLLDTLIKENVKVDIIVSNPPYIAEDDIEVADLVKKHEPHLALYAKEQGLACYKEILEKCKKVLKPQGKIYFEIGYKQKDAIHKIVQDLDISSNIECYQDIYGNDRIIKILLKN